MEASELALVLPLLSASSTPWWRTNLYAHQGCGPRNAVANQCPKESRGECAKHEQRQDGGGETAQIKRAFNAHPRSPQVPAGAAAPWSLRPAPPARWGFSPRLPPRSTSFTPRPAHSRPTRLPATVVAYDGIECNRDGMPLSSRRESSPLCWLWRFPLWISVQLMPNVRARPLRVKPGS